MERHVQAVEGGDEEQIAFSSQSAGCVVADFIFRYQNDHDGTAGPLTWEMVKAEIAARFWLSRQLGPCHVKTASYVQKSFREQILNVAQDTLPNENLVNLLLG